jgi:hypothetical protein
MSLAQSTPPTYRDRNNRRSHDRPMLSKDRANYKKISGKKVSKLSQKTTKAPKWLKSLAMMQKTTTFLSFILLVVTAGLYVWSYNTPQKWSQQYKKLEALQRSERELTAINETYKHQLSQEAQEENSGLVAPTPERVIFLKPTSVKNEIKPQERTDNRAERGDSLNEAPFGY